VTLAGFTDLSRIMAGGLGPVLGALGIGAAAVCLWLLRGERARLEQFREEMEILLRQHQTEYRDGIGSVSRTVEFLEISAQNTEDALQGRLTHSLRAQAIKLLRSGMSPEKAASAMGMARADLRLIAKISRILSSPVH
jgi:hypothetical protein